MRVGLSLLTLVPGEMGGSETYARALAAALCGVDLAVQAFVPATAPDAADGLPTTVVPGTGSGGSGASRLVALARARARPGRLRRPYEGLDAVHYPLTIPSPHVDLPVAVTLHDVQHLDLPENFDRLTRTFRRFAYDRPAQRAEAVIVISEFVRERAIERLDLDPARVHAIPLGVDHERFVPSTEPREAFLLYPARRWPHKNHERLFQAFALLRRERPDLRLVLTGGGHHDRSLPEGIELLGPVSDGELVSLYRRAACLVFPSLYEGFGLPPLEAMASGCPVAASNRGAIPEVCGEAAVLFEPEDPEAIAAGVLEALDRADALREEGLSRAASFTWKATAQAHADVYRTMAR